MLQLEDREEAWRPRLQSLQVCAPPPSLTSWACRRLAFHSWRMITSHCWSELGLRKWGGRFIRRGTPGTCLLLCWLPDPEMASGFKVSTSSLKRSVQQPRGGLLHQLLGQGPGCLLLTRVQCGGGSLGPGIWAISSSPHKVRMHAWFKLSWPQTW